MSVPNYIDKIKILEEDNRALLDELRKLKRRPTSSIAFVVMTIGIILVLISIVHSNQVSMIIGIAVIFWGSLIIYIRPTRFVRKDLLDSVGLTVTKDLNKLLRNNGYQGKPRYLSKNSLENIKNVILFIPKKDVKEFTIKDDFWTQNIYYDNPEGVKLKPTGIILSKLIENELGKNLIMVDLGYLTTNLEKAVIDLQLVRTFKIEVNENLVNVRITGSMFNEYYENGERNVDLLIDPLTSCIACMLVIVSRKMVQIHELLYDGDVINIIFSLLENEKETSSL